MVLDPELEAKIPSRKLDYPGQLQRITRRLRAMPQTARVRDRPRAGQAHRVLTREAEALKRELRDLIRAHRPELLAETGCGPLTAAILIGQTAGAERFAQRRSLRKNRGRRPDPRVLRATRPPPPPPRRQPPTQPRPAHHRHHPRPHRPATRAYLARKEAEGKTRMEAMRCLKRHLARRYYRLLSEGSNQRSLLPQSSPAAAL